MTARKTRHAGRPPLPPEERRVRIDITLAPATIEALDALAAERGASRSAMIERLVEVAHRRRMRETKRAALDAIALEEDLVRARR